MTRNEAASFTKLRLTEFNLADWHVRLVSGGKNDLFLGKCSSNDKTIYLNAHHIDQHPDIEIQNTINHEIAHALCPERGHDNIWAQKALELGCLSTNPCATYGLSPAEIDAI